MTDEEIQREREEAERLIREINATIDRINRVNQENAQLEYELEQSINNVKILIGNCGEMDKAVYEQMGFLSGKVGEADISTKHVLMQLTNSPLNTSLSRRFPQRRKMLLNLPMSTTLDFPITISCVVYP